MLRRLVEQVLAEDDINFEKCCRPILIAMNIFGIPLRMKNDKDPTPLSIWIVYVYGWILYCINVASGLMLISTEKGERDTYFLSNRTTAWQWNLGITTYNSVCSVIATHTVLLAITAVRWKDLVRIFHRMERINQFGLKEFETFRTIFRVGLFFAIIVSFINYINYLVFIDYNNFWFHVCILELSGDWFPFYFCLLSAR